MRRSFANLGRPYQDFLLSLLDVGATPMSEMAANEAYYRLTDDADLPPEKIAGDLDGHFIRRRVRPRSPIFSSVANETSCEWIHPSWRDIAIEFLADHKARRKHFLNSCSITGIGLALSVGGGSEGDRKWPLLCEEEDWNALDGRVVTIASEAEDLECDQLIAILKNALSNAEDSSNASRRRLSQVAGNVLDAVRLKWDSSRAAIRLSYLEAYYDLSVLVKPLRPSPSLDYSWLNYVKGLRDSFGSECLAGDIKDDLESALTFIALVRENEPRFLAQQKFPSEYESVFSSCIQILGKYDYFDTRSSTVDDIDVEIEFLSELGEICQRIGETFRNLEDDANDVISELDGQHDAAREDRDKLERERENEERELEAYWYYESHKSASVSARPVEKPSFPIPIVKLGEGVHQFRGVDSLRHLFDDL